jgi:hypothetical protein
MSETDPFLQWGDFKVEKGNRKMWLERKNISRAWTK